MNNLVQFNEEHNCGTTTSLKIAEKFNRQHKTVLAAINDLEIPQEFIEQNFLPYSYIAKNGKANPAYEITFDGFTLLAMGFTGKKAMEFKVKYIKAFRAMEAELRKRQDKPVIVSEHTRSLPSGKKEIVLSEKAKAEIGGIVKSCVAFAVREELAAILSGSGKTEYWEVSDRDLLYQLYHWHATKNKKDTLEFRRLHAENDRLAAENADLKNRMSQISSWVR